MIDPLVMVFFTKEATGMTYEYLKQRREIAKSKPEPFKLPDPIGKLHRKHIKGMVQPRMATKRPALMATKSTAPLNIGGNPRTALKLKRNQS